MQKTELKSHSSILGDSSRTASAFIRLVDLMKDLRIRCDWDRVQTLHTLRAYLLEETYEVLEVIDALTPDGEGINSSDHRDELGDLLLQIIFQAEIQCEQKRFDIADVCDAIYNKLIRRHPHLYGPDQDQYKTPPSWEALKRIERAAKGEKESIPSALDGVPKSFPGLLRAYRMGEKAHQVGFDWPDTTGVLAKIREELEEVQEAVEAGDKNAIEGEIGDLLYAVVNLSRHYKLDPESALRKTMKKFENRFRYVEKCVAKNGGVFEDCALEVLESYWQDAKSFDD